MGKNVRYLIDRKDEAYCFRLHKERVYYVSESLMRRAANFPRKALLSLGTCLGKFTKGGKFRLVVTALDFLAPYAKYKVWVKPSQELSFLYGNNILKSGLAKITENTPQYHGVVVYSLTDVPLGFGLAARSTQQCRFVDSSETVIFHQADVGEYLREEQTLS
jgi:60S ribosome subunit biogenesis protein NIP7